MKPQVLHGVDMSNGTIEQVIAEAVAAEVRRVLEEWDPSPPAAPVTPTDQDSENWRVLFWTVDRNVRIGMEELMAGLNVGKSWVYARTSNQCPRNERIPHRYNAKGELEFLVGEARDYWTSREEIGHPGSMAKEKLKERSA